MRKSIFVFTFILFLFNACTQRNITCYYEYGGLVLTRADDKNNIYLYEGRLGREEIYQKEEALLVKKEQDIFTDFRMRIERENILIIGGIRYINNSHNNSIIIISYDSINQNHVNSPSMANLYGKHKVLTWNDSISLFGIKYPNVIFVSSDIEREKEENEKQKTKVKIVYFNP